MIKSKDEIIQALTAALGTEDADLEIIENVTDTLTDFETRTADNTNWHERYDELDASWRQRYHDRFTGAADPEEDQVPEVTEKLTYESLFEEE